MTTRAYRGRDVRGLPMQFHQMSNIVDRRGFLVTYSYNVSNIRSTSQHHRVYAENLVGTGFSHRLDSAWSTTLQKSRCSSMTPMRNSYHIFSSLIHLYLSFSRDCTGKDRNIAYISGVLIIDWTIYYVHICTVLTVYTMYRLVCTYSLIDILFYN